MKARLNIGLDEDRSYEKREDLVWKGTACPDSHSVALEAQDPETNPGCVPCLTLSKSDSGGFLCVSVSVTNMGILCAYIPGSCLD